MATILADLGRAYFAAGDTLHAVDLAQQALYYGQETDDRIRGLTLMNLGLTMLQVGDFEGSVRALKDALQVARQAGDRRQEAAALTALARTQVQLARYSDAESALARASELALELDDPKLVSEASQAAEELRQRTVGT
jgi:tetratricopeptide (TPR) repeat protein